MGSKVLTVGVTVTTTRCPAGTLKRTMRSRPCEPRHPLLVAVKSLA